MIVSDVSMKAITGASGRLATRAPLRRPMLVAYPSAGARTTVLSRFHFALSSCALSWSTSDCRCSTSKPRPESRSNNCVIWARRVADSFSCASIALTCASYGTGSMRNSTSPALSGLFASTGTSITSPATLGTIETELRTSRTGPCGAPHPIGMNSPRLSSSRTMNGDAFQNRLKVTMPKLHQQEQQHEIHRHDCYHHDRGSLPCEAGTST